MLLKPDFNQLSSFALYWVDKVTTERLSFVSVVANLVFQIPEEISAFWAQVKMTLISQLI